MTNLERVSYIRGLMEGLELETDKKEVKVLTAIMDLLEDMALSLSEVENTCEDMANQLDAVDEDLCCLEDDYYGDRDEEDEEECYYEVTCPSCQETICLSEDVLEAGEIDCPNCGESLVIDHSVLEEGVIQCPAWKEKFAIDLSDGCGEDGCGCGCHDHEDEE